MTVSYTGEVATAKLGTFGRLLLRWKGSVYKLIWKELLIYVSLYIFIALIYRLVLPIFGYRQMQAFEAWADYCKTNASLIPLTFVLGFFVSLIITRWWSILGCIGYPDRACFCINVVIPSDEPLMVEYRRAIARYLNLAQVLVLRDVSTSVKTRFPTLDKVVAGGFMTPKERIIYDNLKGENQLEKHHKYWLAIHWAVDTLCRVADQKKVRDEPMFKMAVKEILELRDKLGGLLRYDWVTIPLSYTQVVTLVVYSYFLTNIVGKQYLHEENRICEGGTITSTTVMNDTGITNNTQYGTVPAHVGGVGDTHPTEFIQKYFPIFPIVEFLFYMGWLKVAESVMNPLGQDDDDFEINYVINRNLAVSYAIVDSYRGTCPEVKHETAPSLPESNVKAKQPQGSAVDYQPSKKDTGDVPVKKVSDEPDIGKAEGGVSAFKDGFGPSKPGTSTQAGDGLRSRGGRKKKKVYTKLKVLLPSPSMEPAKAVSAESASKLSFIEPLTSAMREPPKSDLAKTSTGESLKNASPPPAKSVVETAKKF